MSASPTKPRLWGNLLYSSLYTNGDPGPSQKVLNLVEVESLTCFPNVSSSIWLYSEIQVGPPHSSPVTGTSTEEAKPSLYSKTRPECCCQPGPWPKIIARDGRPVPTIRKPLLCPCWVQTGGLRGHPRLRGHSLMGIWPPLLLAWFLGILFEIVSMSLAWQALGL